MSTLKWNLNEPKMIKTGGIFNFSSGFIAASNFGKTNLFWSNKVVWVIFTNFSKAFLFYKTHTKNANFSKIQDLRHYNSLIFFFTFLTIKTKPDLESWGKNIKIKIFRGQKYLGDKNSARPLINCATSFFPDAPHIYL